MSARTLMARGAMMRTGYLFAQAQEVSRRGTLVQKTQRLHAQNGGCLSRPGNLVPSRISLAAENSPT